jgi:hypothetical protein
MACATANDDIGRQPIGSPSGASTAPEVARRDAAPEPKASAPPPCGPTPEPSALRADVERELAMPPKSEGIVSILFPGAELVAKRGETAIPAVLEIVRNYRGNCMPSSSEEWGRRYFLVLAGLEALGHLCRKDADAERIVPLLAEVVRDTEMDSVKRGYAVVAMAWAAAPAAVDALRPLYLSLHAEGDPMQDYILGELADTHSLRARELLDDLALSGDRSTRARVQKALDEHKFVRMY